MSERPIMEAFAAVADLGVALGVEKINTLPGCWEHQIDDDWRVAMNGHREEVKDSSGAGVPPFHIYIEWKGWPAGLINPYGGSIVAGGNACEDSFIAAVRAATPATLNHKETTE